jgi:hypothetical protein
LREHGKLFAYLYKCPYFNSKSSAVVDRRPVFEQDIAKAQAEEAKGVTLKHPTPEKHSNRKGEDKKRKFRKDHQS